MSFSHTNIDVDSEDFEDAERGRLELLEDFESPPSSIVELPQLAQKQKLRASTIKNESDIQKKTRVWYEAQNGNKKCEGIR